MFWKDSMKFAMFLWMLVIVEMLMEYLEAKQGVL